MLFSNTKATALTQQNGVHYAYSFNVFFILKFKKKNLYNIKIKFVLKTKSKFVTLN